MRLLHVISSADPSGGGPIEGIKQLAEVHAQLGNTVEVATLDCPGELWLREFPLPVYPLGPPYTHYRYSSRLMPWIKKNAQHYDAVIVNGLWQYGGLAVRQALHGTNTPYFVFTHGMLDPWFKHTYPLKHAKKWLYWPWGEYRVLRDAHAVFFTCEEERLLARQSFWLYRCNEAVVSYGTATPSVDIEEARSTFYRAWPELRNRRLLLFLSRIHEKKGCDLLLRAFAHLVNDAPGLHLVMAGPDQTGWGETLQELARELGIADRVTWTGMLAGNMKWGAYYVADAFVLPSHQENFGIVVAEALACGLPVLISDKVNIWREIKAYGAGLVARDTEADTLQLLKEWLALDEEALCRMRESAIRCFSEKFEIHQASSSLLNAIQTSIREGSKNNQLTSTCVKSVAPK